MTKKLVSAALTAVTVTYMSGAFLFVPVASAQSTADLQAQIAALLAQVQQLQAQLASQTGSSSSVSSSYNFTRDLTVGSTGNDVKALQQFLNANGAQVAASGAGSPGNESSYFGSLTKAALAKFQSAHGISPAAGYFGPITRAYLASMATTTTPPSSTGGSSSSGGSTTPPAPASGLVVSMSASNPAAGSLISSGSSAAARVPVLAFNLTAGNAGAVTVTELKLHKNGVLSDTAVSGAYLVENGKVLAQYSSISNGVIDFAGLNLTVNAGQTRTLTLAIDPASGLNAGNTVSFSMASASDVSAVDVNNVAVVSSGSFPVNGNLFTVTTVSNPSLATMSLSSSSVGTTVYAGTTGVLVSQWTASVSNSPVWLSSLKFTVVGSANKMDLKNVTLKVNGVTVGSPLAAVSADGSAYFDLSANPVKLNTGSSNVQVYADVMGSPSYNFDFGILNNYDVYAIDSQYSVPVSVTVNGGGTGSTSGHQVTINQGQITVSADSGSPTSNLALGASGATLAKFDIYAAGEAIKVKFLDFNLTFTGTTSTISTMVKNIQLVDDAGNQVGSTISTPPTSNTCAQGTAGYNAAGTVYQDCFGTSSSQINYTVPANTTRVLSLKADVQTGAAFTTVTAKLAGNSSNLQGLTSSQSNSSGAASGNALTLSTTPLTSSLNGALANQTYAKGSSGVKIGSYTLTASSAEGENVSNFTISTNASSSNFQNLKAMVGSTQIGSTYSTVSSGNYTFAGNIAVPAGGSTLVGIYADILTTNTGNMGAVTSFVSCTGTGASTFSSASCSGTPTGQNITVSSGPTVTVSNNNSLASRQVVMGNSQVSLAKTLITDTAGIEPIRVQTLTFNVAAATTTAGQSTPGQAFSNLKLYDASGNPISGAGPVSLTGTAPNYTATFNLTGNTLVVPQGGSLSVELRGDVTPFSVGSNIENTTQQVKISSISNVTAYGQSSNASVTVTGTPTFATLTTLRSKLNLSGVALGTDSTCGGYSTGNSTTARSRTSVDYVSCIHLSADPSGQEVHVTSLTLQFGGAAVSGSFQVSLIDPATQTNYDGSTAQTCAGGAAGSTCAVTFNFSGTAISNNSPKSVVVQANSTGFGNVAQQVDGLDITLPAATSVGFGDGTISGSTVGGLNLSSDVAVPLLVTHVDYN